MKPKRYEILLTGEPHPTRQTRWITWPMYAHEELASIAEARAEIDRIKAMYPWAADLTYWIRKVGNKYPAPLL